MKTFNLLLSVGLSIGSLATAQEAKQMTVDQLIAKNTEAKGGAEALHALQSLKLTGKMLVNEGKMEFARARR
jgi:hypothetical protein